VAEERSPETWRVAGDLAEAISAASETPDGLSKRSPPAPAGAGKEIKLARETAAVAAGASVLALLVLRAGPQWRHGVIGHGGDAWQNLWNLDHLERALRGGPLLFSPQVWAPEGASLLSHTLALPLSLPATLLARLTGPFLAYDLAVVATYALAAVALYRFARRLGASPAGAALGALVFAFSPQRSARALGHLNLLGLGFLPLGLEGLWLAARREGRRRVLPALLAGMALAALALTDWYLAVLGALACCCFALVELVRAPASEREHPTLGVSAHRLGLLAAFALAALVALAATLPFAIALRRETAASGTGGHDARWCSSALTSLVVPSRVQLASRCTGPLTERNHQNPGEGASYLGLVPLAATLWVAVRKRVRALDFALLAGGLGLLLALGPQPRVFDRLLELPLPYALAERLLPALRVGGCVNRYIQIIYLPLALGTAFAADRLLAARRRGLLAAGALLLAFEYAPADPGVTVPDDGPGLAALNGNVLDVDTGAGALARQLVHRQPQLFGYLSRTPPRSLRLRSDDPLLGPLLSPEATARRLPPAAAGALLRHRWGAATVLAPDSSPLRERALALGFPRQPSPPGGLLVFRVPEEPLAPLPGAALAEPAEERGVFAWGFAEAASLLVDGPRVTGRFCGEGESVLLLPLAPGAYALEVASAGAGRLELRWGRGRTAVRTVTGRMRLPLPVAAHDLAPDGTLTLSLRVAPFGSAGRVLVIALQPG